MLSLISTPSGTVIFGGGPFGFIPTITPIQRHSTLLADREHEIYGCAPIRLRHRSHSPSKNDASPGPHFGRELGGLPIQLKGLANHFVSELALRDRVFGAYWLSASDQIVWHVANREPKYNPSCDAVPAARGIPKGFELKSLVLRTGASLWVAHLPAERRLSLRNTKAVLGLHDLCLAPRSALPAIPGRICALCEPIASLPAIVCDRLLAKPMVSTNDSTIESFFFFPPEVLLTMGRVHTATISD